MSKFWTNLILWVAPACFVMTVPAQVPFEKQGRFGQFDRQLLYDGPQPFDVIHSKLDIRLSMETDSLLGRSTITMLLKSAVDSIVLHAVGLRLDTVKVDGLQKAISMNTADETFTIYLGTVRNPGDTLAIDIAYERIVGHPRPSSRQGYYFFRDTLGLPSNLGYTFSEPSDARFWMPCYDEPWEKGTADINITVPAGYVAASNGRLLGTTNNGNGTVTWRWREDHQIATYLMCMTASRFSISTLPYVSTSGDTVPLQYYAWNVDSASCAAYLTTVGQMVGAYSGLFGEYPFDKYGMTVIVPFGYLGMEHQTLTTLNRFAATRERVVSHELAHQWWGDDVTCGTWRDIWLNESFATYSEALWKEHIGGLTALRNYMKDSLEHFFFGSWQGALYDPVGQGFNLFDDLVYGKGAWILHTLRGVVGDSMFFHVLNSYRQRFAGKSAVTTEFAAVVDSVVGIDMGWFFNQWVFGRGWPVYAWHATYQSADSITVEVAQLQDQNWPTYRMPIRLRVNYLGGGDTTVVVWDSLRLQTFSIPVSSQPGAVELDPDNWILKQTLPWPLSVEEHGPVRTFRLHQNFPNPFNASTTIAYSLAHMDWVSLKVFDLLGREVATLVNGYQQPGERVVNFNGDDLSSGIYVYRINSGGNMLSQRMILMK